MQNITCQEDSSINLPKTISFKGHQANSNHPENNQTPFIHKVEVKGTITGLKPKTIEIHPQSNKFIVYDSEEDREKGKAQQFPLHKLTFSYQKRQDKGKKDCLEIDTNNGKKYSLRGSNSGTIAEQILKCQTTYKINNSQNISQPVNMIPKQVNYMTTFGMDQFQKILIPQTTNFFSQNIRTIIPHCTQSSQDFSKYPHRPFYFNPEDWQVNPHKGTIVFINEQKKKSQKKVIGWIIKKFITSRSFMGISFPTFIMKPQTILESYAKAIGAAPILFDSVVNPVERMKKFVCLIQSFSLVFCDLTKPFNPPLGETYQAKIGNGNYFAEQICHHPPISAFMYEGNGYTLWGSMELTASIGPNSASGLFVGDLKLRFNDGMVFTGRLPAGQFSGFMIGSQKFQASGSFYTYNNKNLICSISSTEKCNFFTGFIGKLKPIQQQEFKKQAGLGSRFEKFSFYGRESFETVYSSLEMAYNSLTLFDGKEYFNVQDKKYLPLLPEEIEKKRLVLKSDSRLRKDVALRGELKFQESQAEKERIEEEERYFRKLRAKYDPSHHKAS